MATQFPFNLTIVDNVGTQELANHARANADQIADFLLRTSSYLHPMMVETLRVYGLDGTNRFGFGSDAQKAADSVINPWRRAAQHYVDAGQLVGFGHIAFEKNVWIPYQLAKAARENGPSSRLLRGA